MKLRCCLLPVVLPVLAFACGGSVGAPPVRMSNPDAGVSGDVDIDIDVDGADAARGGEEAGAACPPPHIFPAFVTTRIARVEGVGSIPSVTIGPDGSARVLFAGGDLEQRAIFGADPRSGAVSRLSRAAAESGARFTVTTRGELRGTYVDREAVVLRYLEWDGDPRHEAMDLAITSDPVRVATPAIVLDGHDEPMIAALFTNAADNGSGDFGVVTRREGAWSIEWVATNLGISAPQFAIALDGSGNPVIAAVDAHPGGYAGDVVQLAFGVTIWSRAGATWSTADLDDPSGDLLPHVARTPDGDATVFFSYPYMRSTLGSAVNRNGVWQLRAPVRDAAGGVLVLGESFDVRYGPRGEVHVAYSGKDGGLRYAVHDGCRWNEIVIDANNQGAAPAIALDAEGHPHLAYENIFASQGEGTPPSMTEVWYASQQP
jgi:hypothetical protein